MEVVFTSLQHSSLGSVMQLFKKRKKKKKLPSSDIEHFLIISVNIRQKKVILEITRQPKDRTGWTHLPGGPSNDSLALHVCYSRPYTASCAHKSISALGKC